MEKRQPFPFSPRGAGKIGQMLEDIRGQGKNTTKNQFIQGTVDHDNGVRFCKV